MSRQKMPSVDMINFEGLYTKQNPETLNVTQLRECKNADFFREYGSLSKLRGNSRVLASVYAESAVTKGIYWGASYKSQDLSGAIVRQTIIGAGTTIQQIESDGSVTELLTGEPDSLHRTSSQLDRFLYFTSQDPTDVGKRGQMSKYDGTRVTEWGLTAPGSQTIKFTTGGDVETYNTSIEAFNDSSLFTASNATVADSTQPAWDGTATAMTKGTASTSSYIERLNVTPFAIKTQIADRARMQFFISRADYRKLATTGRAISIYIGSEATLVSNYYRFDFQIGRLFEGWNTLIMDFSTVPSGDFGTSNGAANIVDEQLASYRFEIITNNATDTPTVYWDHFISQDQGAPDTALATAGGLIFLQGTSAAWKYKVTFVDDQGLESNAGPSTTQSNIAGSTDYGQIDLTNIPISKNPACTKRLLYRTVSAGSTFLFLNTINDNTTTTYADTTPDTSLGISTPPELGDLFFDNSPAPSGGITLIWKRTAFIAGDPLNPTILAFSRFNLPDAFPIGNAIEFDERITGLFKTSVGLVVATETSYWRVLADNPDYIVDKVIDGYGCVGMRGTGSAREVGWAVDRDGLRLYDLREAMKVSEVIRDRVDAFDKGSLEDSHTAYSRKNNALFWYTKAEDGVYSAIYQYQHMLDNVRQGWFSQVVPNPVTFNVQHVWEIEDSNGDSKVYAGTAGGMVHEIMADGATNWIDDGGQERAITMELQTAYMRLGSTDEAISLSGDSGRCYPRYIELRIKENTGAAHTWTVTVDTCDSASENATIKATQDITFDFIAGQSLLRLSTQDLVPGEYMRIKLVNSELNKDLSIMGVKIFYKVRPGQFQVEGVSGGGTAAAGGQN